MKPAFLHYLQLIRQGDMLAAIETYYDEDILQVENSFPMPKGKSYLYQHEEKNLSQVKELVIEVIHATYDEHQDLAMGTFDIQFVDQKGATKRLEEAFIQKWKDGKIAFQRFYYEKIKAVA